MDRIHFIEQQVERLDDQAFAAFLTWLDRYADLRWTGRWPNMVCEPQPAAWLAQAPRGE